MKLKTEYYLKAIKAAIPAVLFILFPLIPDYEPNNRFEPYVFLIIGLLMASVSLHFVKKARAISEKITTNPTNIFVPGTKERIAYIEKNYLIVALGALLWPVLSFVELKSAVDNNSYFSQIVHYASDLIGAWPTIILPTFLFGALILGLRKKA